MKANQQLPNLTSLGWNIYLATIEQYEATHTEAISADRPFEYLLHQINNFIHHCNKQVSDGEKIAIWFGSNQYKWFLKEMVRYSVAQKRTGKKSIREVKVDAEDGYEYSSPTTVSLSAIQDIPDTSESRTDNIEHKLALLQMVGPVQEVISVKYPKYTALSLALMVALMTGTTSSVNGLVKLSGLKQQAVYDNIKKIATEVLTVLKNNNVRIGDYV